MQPPHAGLIDLRRKPRPPSDPLPETLRPAHGRIRGLPGLSHGAGLPQLAAIALEKTLETFSTDGGPGPGEPSLRAPAP